MEPIQHLINGQDFGEPRNWEDLEITIDWQNKKEAGTINVSDLSFVGEANEYLQQRIMNGLFGGVGVFEGEPYEIKVGPIGNPIFTFKGYLDFTEQMTVIGGEEITVSLKKELGEDWLNDVADSFSFAYLYDKGTITNSDFVKVPYVINYVPDGMQLIVLSMSIFMMTKEIIENIQEISESIAILIDANTPVPVASVPPGLGWDVGNYIWAALKVVARIAYTIAMLIAIKNLIEELFEQLMPKKRFHLGMTFRRLFEKGCENLGLQFVSSIPELDFVHIPRKDKKGGESGERGFPDNTGPIYTFGDLIREKKQEHNADFRIINGVFYFERRDSFEVVGGYVVPPYFNNQERLLQQFQLNTDEMISNYNIFYNYDIQDQNTLDDQTGRVFQAITSPISKINEKFVNVKNLTQIEIPFSQGKEKKGLTAVEELLKELGRIVDNVTGIFGGGTNFANQIENRIGSLLLSSHFLTIGKVVVMNGDKLANNQRDLLSSRKLWNKYHFINSFAEIDGEHNQFLIFKDQPVPMTLNEFNQVMQNNKCTDSDGNEIFLQLIRYNPNQNKAIIDFRIKRKYTNNLKIDYVE